MKIRKKKNRLFVGLNRMAIIEAKIINVLREATKKNVLQMKVIVKKEFQSNAQSYYLKKQLFSYFFLISLIR